MDLTAPALQPVFDPVSHLLYVAGREQVRQVWVRGEQRVRDGELVAGLGGGSLSPAALREMAHGWAARLQAGNPS